MARHRARNIVITATIPRSLLQVNIGMCSTNSRSRKLSDLGQPAVSGKLHAASVAETPKTLTHSLPLVSTSRLDPSMSLAPLRLHSRAGSRHYKQAPSFFKQELAGFSNDQRFVYYEHVVVGVMQLDDSRVLHA